MICARLLPKTPGVLNISARWRPACCRSFQEPLGPTTEALLLGMGLVRAGTAPRRHAARRAHQHHRGPRGVAHPAAASARAGVGVTCPAVGRRTWSTMRTTLDAMLSFADRMRADDGITDVVNIDIGGSRPWGRTWPCWRWMPTARRVSGFTSFPTPMVTSWRACCGCCGRKNVSGGLQNIHHGRNHDQRTFVPGLVCPAGWHGCGAPFCGAHRRSTRRKPWVSPPRLVLGVGGRALFLVVVHWPAAGHISALLVFRG